MQDAGSPPDKPDGDMQDGAGTPPDKPDGEAPGGNGAPPEKPDGDRPENGPGNGGPGGEPPEGGAGGPGMSAEDIEYVAADYYYENATETDITVKSDGEDESAVIVDEGAAVDIRNFRINRKNGDSTGGDSSSFYGVGAAVLDLDGTLTLYNGDITTDAKGGAGVFSYGDGTVYVRDVSIYTKQSTSGGLHAAGGGTLYAWDVIAETEGESSAAIRSDRGGGTMVIDGGTYTSHGTGSPALYCTADITVHDAELATTGSEGLCLEGLNTVRLFDVDLESNMPDNRQNDNTWSVILYQSMSGDSEVGEGSFVMTGGSLKSTNGGLFYSTNTESRFYLSDVKIDAEAADYFLKVTGNSNQRGWGRSGANGARTVFTADSQKLDGDVIWDSISTLDLYLANGSALTGAIIDDESNAGAGGSGYASIYIDSSSKWTVLGDSRVTDLYIADPSEDAIKDVNGKTVSIVDPDGKVYIDGDSSYTITVDGYHTEVDMSGADTGESWEDYVVDQPEVFPEAKAEASDMDDGGAAVSEPSAADHDKENEPVSEAQAAVAEGTGRDLEAAGVVAGALAASIAIGVAVYSVLRRHHRKRR